MFTVMVEKLSLTVTQLLFNFFFHFIRHAGVVGIKNTARVRHIVR